MRRLIALATLFFVLLIPMTVTADDKVLKDQIIPMDDHYSDSFILVSKDQEIKVDITTNASVDIYIVSSSQMIGYPGSFTPQYKVLNTQAAKFTWKQPDDASYTMIIDNEKNGNISASADPKGPVTFSMTRSDPFSQSLEEAAAAISMFCIAVVAVVVIIIVVVIVIIVMVARKKKAQPQQPFAPAPAYGQTQYGAAQYGQQPQQYYQPPPGQYQPPPPPPGTPPGQ